MSWEIDDIITNSNCIITVDFHRSGANNFLPEEVVPNIILDHHMCNRGSNCRCVDAETRIFSNIKLSCKFIHAIRDSNGC